MRTIPRVVLASTSIYRDTLLKRLGVPFEVCAPVANEDQLKKKLAGLNPRALAEGLAEEKARSVWAQASFAEAIVIGCDQVAALGDQILDKPGNFEVAIRQLKLLSGQTFELITAICVLFEEEIHKHTDCTRLTLRNLRENQMVRYLKTDQPYDCAGSFKLESQGIALFSKIETNDYTAIMGLPLMALANLLGQCGIEVP